MKNGFGRRDMLTWASFALSVALWGQSCFGVDRGHVLTLDERVAQNETLWKDGKALEYYQVAIGIGREIEETAAPGKTNLNDVAAALLDHLLSKGAPASGVDEQFEVEDLSAMELLAGYLSDNQGVSPGQRQTNVRLLSRCLGRIRKEIVPNFAPKRVTENVDPPRGTPGPAFSGMNPEAIADPVARTKYKEAIRQNRLNSVENTRQTFLRRTDRIVKQPIINYMVETFNSGAISSVDLAECMKSAGLADTEKNDVASRINRK